MAPYSSLWQHKSGPVSWADQYDSSRYAQAIKAKGNINDEYAKKFEELKKSSSSIDDDEGWMTLKSQRNNIPGTAEEFGKLADEWKAAGFDVRVHDLDESVDGAKWADIAVRKGPGVDEPEEEVVKKEEKMEMSPEYAHAKARVAQWTEDVTSGRTGKELFGQAPDSTSFLDRYKLHLGERLENGNYRPKEYKADASVVSSDEAATNELTRAEKDPRKDY